MKIFELGLASLFLLALLSAKSKAEAFNCKSILSANSAAPSGTYILSTTAGLPFKVYCEMGLNGGGYTFLSPESLAALADAQVSRIFTDRTTFLLRVRKTDGTQPYAVLSQLAEYSSIELKLGLSNNIGYQSPSNIIYNRIQPPFLYFGFLSIANASNNNIQGLTVNGFRVTFKNKDKNPNSYFALFSDFKETIPYTHSSRGAFGDQLFSHLVLNPSGRVMPPELFLFGETHWGGGGCYVQSNQIPGVLGFSIGFR